MYIKNKFYEVSNKLYLKKINLMENIISDLAKNELKGIIPVVQIPFDEYLKIDWKSLENLINYTLKTAQQRH